MPAWRVVILMRCRTVKYEVSGSVRLGLSCAAATSCGGASQCKANSTAIVGKFSSLEPKKS